MDREPIKIDSSHDRWQYRMAGAEERDRSMRCFPHPLPNLYHMVHSWGGTNDMYLSIGPEPITVDYVLSLCKAMNIQVVNPPEAGAATVAPIPVAPKPVVAHQHPSPGSPADVENKARGAMAARRVELEKLKKPELVTKGAEIGVELANSLSVAQMAARIVEKEVALAKETVGV